MMIATLLFLASVFPVPADTVQQAFAGRAGAFVLEDAASGEVFRSDVTACTEKLAPCSTFKIWNSAIGLETKVVTDPDAPFWKWDGQKRSIEGWNQDQTMRSAIAVSCVPAYQAMARKIGPERMQEWLDKIGYGNRDISAGIDQFWLPDKGRKTILITPEEQAHLLSKLTRGETPFSADTLAKLKSIMMLKRTSHGVLYGKTGTGSAPDGVTRIGWFVGYVESGGKTYTFASVLKGDGVMGTDARAATESILTERGLL